MLSKNYIILALSFLTLQSVAQQGLLDTTFSNDGKLILMPSASHDNANAILVQSDGTILFTGVSTTQPTTGFDIIVGRLHPDGTLDSTFGTNGYVILDYNGYFDVAYDIDLTDEGKILITGGISNTPAKVDMFTMRLMPNGSYDTTFGDSGLVVVTVNSDQDYAKEAVIQPDGKIVLGGYSKLLGDNRAALVRLNPNGSLDSTFGSGGIALPNIPTQSEQIEGLVLKPDGGFIGVGYETTMFTEQAYLWGILPNGSLDISFANFGTLQIYGMHRAKAIVRGDNQYYACGHSIGSPEIGYMVNISDSGTLDPTFGFSGIVRDTFTAAADYNDLKLQQDGKIIGAGRNGGGDFMITRFKTDGTLDSSFGANGRAVIDLLNSNSENSLGVAIQDDGKIVACGVMMQTNNDMAFIRLNGATINTGIFPPNILENSVVIYPNPSNGNFTISFPTEVKNQTVRVMNTLGEIVFTAYISNESQMEINLPNVSAGIYFVEMAGVDGNVVKRVMVK